jgi:hypothetical protein
MDFHEDGTEVLLLDGWPSAGGFVSGSIGSVKGGFQSVLGLSGI